MLVPVWGAIGIGVNLRAQNPAPGVGPRPGSNGKTSAANEINRANSRFGRSVALPVSCEAI